MSQCEEDVSHGRRGSRLNKGSPLRLVAKLLSFIVVKPLILLMGGCLVAVMTPSSVLLLTEEPQPVPGARASQHPSCCCSSPLQALLGEASVLGGRPFVAITFSSTLKDASALSVCVLCTWAQSCHEQQPNPQREKLLLASHYCRSVPCKNTPTCVNKSDR